MSWISGLISAAQGARQNSLDKNTAARQEQQGEFQAQDAERVGTIEEMRYRRQVAALIGRQRNEIGARNVEARGSALDLLEDSAQLGEEDVVQIRNNAARQAWGYRANASEQSRVTRQEGTNAAARGGASALTSGIQAYGKWKETQ